MSRNFIRDIMESYKNVRGSRTDDEYESGLRRRKVRVTACVRGILRLEYETRSPHLPILFGGSHLRARIVCVEATWRVSVGQIGGENPALRIQGHPVSHRSALLFKLEYVRLRFVSTNAFVTLEPKLYQHLRCHYTVPLSCSPTSIL